MFSHARKVMIVTSVLLLSACSTTNEGGDITTAEREEITTTSSMTSAVVSGVAPGTQEELNTTIGDRVLFGYDRYDLTSDARDTLSGQADWMQYYGDISLIIEGHADERGTREYNLALGERRANAVKNYLTALGVMPSRLTVISYGKERPAVAGSDSASWAQNRRGVTVVE